MNDHQEKFTFFWRHRLGQWSKTHFDVDGEVYSCCEQWMMAEKARLFGDDDVLEQIMDTNNPKDHKNFGRKVKNFDPAIWDQHKRQIVYRGNFHRFYQNPSDREVLFATKGTTLVEASPYDKIWGIGLKANDPRAQSRDTWQGENCLGEVLTKVREDLMKIFPEGG